MAAKQKIRFYDGLEVVHLIGPGQGDVALCGQDLAGDSGRWAERGGWDSGVSTTEKVDCKDCKSIVLFSKKIKLTEFSNK